MILTLKHKIALLSTLFFIIVCVPLPTQSVSNLERFTASQLKVDVKQIACMARNIYHEAGSETTIGQAAVARVVLNRVRQGFAETPCKVIYQKTTFNENTVCQFSWVCAEKADPSKGNLRFKQAQRIAYEVMVFDMYKNVVPNTALFFHAVTVDPSWPYKQVAKIGNHIFYSKQKSTVNKSNN